MELGGESGCWFLYFAYGSNLLRERLLLRNPSAALCALARLQVREGAAGGAAGGLREPHIPEGSPTFLQAARVPPRSRVSPSVPPTVEAPARIRRGVLVKATVPGSEPWCPVTGQGEMDVN